MDCWDWDGGLWCFSFICLAYSFLKI
jgi:hypothetical protein